MYNCCDETILEELFAPSISFQSNFVGISHPFLKEGQPYVPVRLKGLESVSQYMRVWHCAVPDVVVASTSLVVADDGASIVASVTYSGTNVHCVTHPANDKGFCDQTVLDKLIVHETPMVYLDGTLRITVNNENRIKSIIADCWEKTMG